MEFEMNQKLRDELDARIKQNNHPLQIQEIAQQLKNLGYKLDRSLDCASMATWKTGERAGASYPVLTTGVKEIDTGRSAFNVQSRRDDNFQKLQALRFAETYAVTRGRILEF